MREMKTNSTQIPKVTVMMAMVRKEVDKLVPYNNSCMTVKTGIRSDSRMLF